MLVFARQKCANIDDVFFFSQLDKPKEMGVGLTTLLRKFWIALLFHSYIVALIS